MNKNALKTLKKLIRNTSIRYNVCQTEYSQHIVLRLHDTLRWVFTPVFLHYAMNIYLTRSAAFRRKDAHKTYDWPTHNSDAMTVKNEPKFWGVILRFLPLFSITSVHPARLRNAIPYECDQRGKLYYIFCFYSQFGVYTHTKPRAQNTVTNEWWWSRRGLVKGKEQAQYTSWRFSQSVVDVREIEWKCPGIAIQQTSSLSIFFRFDGLLLNFCGGKHCIEHLAPWGIL